MMDIDGRPLGFVVPLELVTECHGKGPNPLHGVGR